MTRTKALLIAGAAGVLTISVQANAQANPDPYQPCSQIVDNAQRLACFDATYAREVTLRETRAREAEERTAAERERERENFGLTGVQIEQLKRDELDEAEASGAIAPEEATRAREEEKQEREKNNEIRTTILEVLTDRQRNTVFLLENGQVWRATSNRSYRGSIKEGWAVTIRKSGLSGYRLTFDDRNGYIGVRRIR